MMPPRGNLDAVKWFALALMVGDHVNTALFAGALPVLSEVSRVVMPLFGAVLGYNLAVMDARARERAMARCLVVGVLAQPCYMLAFGFGLLPLNIVLAFACVLGIAECVERRWHLMAAAVFLSAGAVCEFRWPGLAVPLVVACAVRYQGGKWTWLVGVVAACFAVEGGQWYPLAAVPLFVLLQQLSVCVPRAARFFYGFYPAHLAALALVVYLSG